MSVQTEITRITGAKSAIATAITGLGVTVPAATKIDGYAALINTVQIQHYYTGSTAPTSALGVDGDVFLQTSEA